MKASKLYHINTEIFNATERRIPYEGDEFHLIDASLALDITFYNHNNAVICQVNGLTYFSCNVKEISGQNFYMVGIASPGGNCTPDFVVADNFKFNALKMSAIVTTQKATSKTSSASVIKADTETLVVAANSSRRDLIIKNKSGNGGTVWTGGAVDTGIPIESGEVYIFENFSGAITLYSELATEICVEQVLG